MYIDYISFFKNSNR